MIMLRCTCCVSQNGLTTTKTLFRVLDFENLAKEANLSAIPKINLIAMKN